ncbi:unnamed protein product, partial [Mesorhabditis belari]|uniref:Uncharacterized protein n=1 Tax=Mesorhabditis belari TaxID=2138241 RepID=A0AAF3EZB8_9BILA
MTTPETGSTSEYVNQLWKDIEKECNSILETINQIDDLNRQQQSVSNAPASLSIVQIDGWKQKLFTTIDMHKSESLEHLEEEIGRLQKRMAQFEETLQIQDVPLSESFGRDSLNIINGYKEMIDVCKRASEDNLMDIMRQIKQISTLNIDALDSHRRLKSDLWLI